MHKITLIYPVSFSSLQLVYGTKKISLTNYVVIDGYLTDENGKIVKDENGEPIEIL